MAKIPGSLDLVDNAKYYQLGSKPEEIQISENEMASDPDRHRSLNKYRRVPYGEITTNWSILSHAGHAVMLL
jgi:hypothetical protein